MSQLQEYLQTSKEGILIGLILAVLYTFVTKCGWNLGIVISIFLMLAGSIIDYAWTALRKKVSWKNAWFWIFLVGLTLLFILIANTHTTLFAGAGGGFENPNYYGGASTATGTEGFWGSVFGKGLQVVGIAIISVLGLKLFGNQAGQAVGNTASGLLGSIPLWGWLLVIMVLIVVIKK